MNRTTCASLWFFHQCDVPLVSARISPALCTDRHRAVAGVFDDLAFRDVDQRRTVVVAVPRHHAAGLDHHLAEAQFAALDLRLLLAEIDRAERGVGHALSRMIDRLGAHSACACRPGIRRPARRPRSRQRQGTQAPRPRVWLKLDIVISFVSLWLASSNAADAKMRRSIPRRKCRFALISIASRYFTRASRDVHPRDKDALAPAHKQRITS